MSTQTLERPSPARPPPWMQGPLAAAPGVRRLTLDGREALFCERRQQLFELPPGLASLFDELASARKEADAAAEQARAWVEGGWLAPRTLFERLAGTRGEVLPLRIGALQARVELRADRGDCIGPMLREVLGQFRAAVGADAVRLDVVGLGGAWFVLGEQVPIRVLSAAQVAPEIKAMLTTELCRRTGGGGLLLHAAMLERDGRALLLAGAPGAGKSTLSVALATSGFGYLSDDVVAVTPEGDFCGLAFSPALKPGAWPLVDSRIPAIPALAIHRRADGQAVRYLPLGAMARGAAAAPAMAVLLDRCEGAAAALQPLDPLSALTEVLASAFSGEHRLRGETLALIAERFAAMTCARLVYSDLDEAVALLLAHFAA